MARDEFDWVYEVLGNRVCKARLAAGRMSQTALAKKVGVHRVSIVNIEKGRQRPPVHLLWQVAEALSVDLASLMPTRQDFDAAANGVQLDADTIAQIEAATKDDPLAARQLTEFIQQARARVPKELP